MCVSGLTRNFLLLLHLKAKWSSSEPVRGEDFWVLSKVLGTSRIVAGACFVSIRSLLVFVTWLVCPIDRLIFLLKFSMIFFLRWLCMINCAAVHSCFV